MTARDSAAPLLVGREREQASLHGHLDAALAGRGSLVLIGGEAGIGKTALAEVLCHDATEHHALVLIGRCYDLSETPPYGPWIELFSGYQPTDDLPLPDAFAQRGSVSAVASQVELFHQVRDFLTALATQRPVLLLLDDLHWADPASLDLLRFLARSVTNSSILIIVTYRSDELTRHHALYQLLPVLVREAHADRVDLQRLEDADIRVLITARYQLVDADETRLVTYLHHRSEGNPFFLGELLRTLEAERVLRQTADGWTLGDLTHVRVPLLLRQVIDGRLARLGEETQRLLAVASVIGQDVPFVLWATVAEADEETLASATEQAIAARMLEASMGGDHIRFVHALIREALYEAILPTRRRGMHRRLGEGLAESAQPDSDIVAYHFRQAGDVRAIQWLIQAGERAQRTYAWITAAGRYEAAIALMDGSGTGNAERGWLLYRLARMRRYTDPRKGIAYMDEAIQWATQMNEHAFLALLLFDHGLLRCFAGDLRGGLPEMEAGVTALESLSREDLERIAVKNFEGVSVEGYRGTVVLWLAEAGYHPRAREMGNRIVAHAPPPMAEKARGGSGYADAYNGLGYVHAALGNREEARAAFMRGREHHRAAEAFTLLGAFARIQLMHVTLVYDTDDLQERQRLADEGEQAYVLASGAWANLPPRVVYTPILLLSGDWAEAEQLAQAWEMAGRAARFEGFKMLATLACHRSDYERAWAWIREALPNGLATVPGDVPFLDSLEIQRTAIRLALNANDDVTARAWLDMHDRWLVWGEAVLGQSEGQLLWAQYHRAAVDAPLARKHAMQAFAHATEPRQPLALLAAHRLLGELDTDAGRYADAAVHLNTSLALADACAAPYERALTLLALAELRIATHMPTDAQAILDDVRAICTPLDAKPALARADALAAKLNNETKPLPIYPAGLSAREVEVLRLVANGLTNAQVAERLFLSPHTINSHLTAIYNKLGVPSRSAAIRFALEHDLH